MTNEYCPLVDQAPQFEVSSLNELQKKNAGPFCNYNKERTNFFEIIWVKEGLGSISIDLKTYSLLPNTLYCIAPGHARKLHFDASLNGYYVAICAEWLYWIESLVQYDLFGVRYQVGISFPPIKVSNELETLVSNIVIESQNSLPMKTALIKGYAKVLLIQLSRIMDLYNNKNEIEHNDKMIASKFISLLQKNYMVKKNVASYADELCVTPNQLSAIVRRVTGHPASYHIHQIIVLEAKLRARFYGAKLKEVASDLGFDDYSHFSKYFKIHAGQNFSDFRRNDTTIL